MVKLEKIRKNGSVNSVLTNRNILFGKHSDQDTQDTPDGQMK